MFWIPFDLKIYHDIVPYVQYFPIKFQFNPIYGLRDVSNLTELVTNILILRFKSAFEKVWEFFIFFLYFKLIFLMFLDYFDALI
jgi:hypothetical protein